MKSREEVLKERENEEKLKALRRELQREIEEQLPAAMLEPKIRVEMAKADENELLDPVRAKQIIEALLFASSKPLTVQEIKKTLKSLPAKDIEDHIMTLREEYARTGRSFEIHEIAGGYEVGSRKEFAPWICRIELQKKVRQATQSALETLAILAYRQPLTRAEIEDLRGVDSSGVLAGLMERGFIRIAGKKEIPGRPFLYATTEKFLEHFGLNSIGELPSLEEIKGIVEQSVKKEELLGAPKIVEVPEDGGAVPESSADTAADGDAACAGGPGAEDTAAAAEDPLDLEIPEIPEIPKIFFENAAPAVRKSDEVE